MLKRTAKGRGSTHSRARRSLAHRTARAGRELLTARARAYGQRERSKVEREREQRIYQNRWRQARERAFSLGEKREIGAADFCLRGYYIRYIVERSAGWERLI